MGEILRAVAGIIVKAVAGALVLTLVVYGVIFGLEYLLGTAGGILGVALLVLSPVGYVVWQEVVWMRRDAE